MVTNVDIKKLKKLLAFFVFNLAILLSLSTCKTEASLQCRDFPKSEISGTPNQDIKNNAVVAVTDIKPTGEVTLEEKQTGEKLAALIKKQHPDVKPSNLKYYVAEAFIQASLGMMFDPLASQLIKYTGNWQLITIDASLATTLLGMDLINLKKEIDLTPKVIAMLGAMTVSAGAKQRLLGAAPSYTPTTVVVPMYKYQAVAEIATDLGARFAPVLVAGFITSLICQYTGMDTTIVYVGTELVTRTACLTAAKYMAPAAKQAYAGALQIYSDEGVKGLYNRVCQSQVIQGAAYLASLPVTGFNRMVGAVGNRLGF
jgi:hypothetical protein